MCHGKIISQGFGTSIETLHSNYTDLVTLLQIFENGPRYTKIPCARFETATPANVDANPSLAIQFELSQPPSDAVSSLQYAPNSPTRLLVSSWDRHVYLYDTHGAEEQGGKLIEKYEHRAPVLDVCFGADDNEAFTAGMDWQVKR